MTFNCYYSTGLFRRPKFSLAVTSQGYLVPPCSCLIELFSQFSLSVFFSQDYSVSMYLRQEWKDPRLTFTEFRKKEQVRLGEGQWNDIWIPDTFLRNEKAANFHLVTVENRMLKLSAPCTLWYVTK